MSDLALFQNTSFMLKLFRGYGSLHISKQIEKLMFFYFSTMMTAGALAWGAICLFYGHSIPALIPFGYVAMTLINFVLCSQFTESKLGCALQIFTSISLPFLFQYALGGLVSSGFVMLWSVLALLGSMTFQSRKEILFWVGLFSALSIGTFVLETDINEANQSGLPVLLTALNVLSVSIVIFGLAHFFMQMQEKMRKESSKQKKDLILAQKIIDQDLHLAREFQDVLQSNVAMSEGFASHTVINLTKTQVNGNFSWYGEFLQRKVTVFVENPHTGIKGSLEAMMLWNMIENSVSRAEVRAPENLIEFIQRDLYSKYDSEVIRESMKNINITVVCHETSRNEIAYATTGSKLIASAGDQIKVLSGFKGDYGDTILTPTGVSIFRGRFMPYPCAKLLFINDSMLELFDIKNDKDLMDKGNALGGLFEWSFDIAKPELLKKIEAKGHEKDLFLMGIQV